MNAALPAPYVLTDDPAHIDGAAAHAFLSQSYWAEGISAARMARAIANSHCVAVLHDGAQVGFARLVTDYATAAFLTDVYVLPEHRGRGLAGAMVAHLQGDDRLQGLRNWILFTRDAHGVYERAGWQSVDASARLMLRLKPEGDLP